MGINRKLEKRIEREPSRVDLRWQAIRFYHEQKLSLMDTIIFNLTRGKKCPISFLYKRRHILWIIQNIPGTEIVEESSFQISPFFDPEGFDAAEKLWTERLSENPRNLNMLRNAGQFFTLTKPERAMEIYLAASKVEPQSFEWKSKCDYVRWLITSSEIDGLRWNISFWKWKLQYTKDDSSITDALGQIEKYETQLQSLLSREGQQNGTEPGA